MKVLAAIVGIACAVPLAAQTGSITLPIGTPVRLVTAQPLSSKTNVKGDLVALRTAEDVLVAGVVAIPKATPAVGQISDARAKGAMGMGGRLLLRPLYLTVDGRVVRLSGAEDEHGGVQPGAVIGMVLVAPLFTGKSATIAEGTGLASFVTKTVVLRR